MLLDIIIQIDECRNLLLKHAHQKGCPELILFLMKLLEFKNATNGQQELLFIQIVNDFLLIDSIYELNLEYRQKHSVHRFNVNEFDIVENEVVKMIGDNLMGDFGQFIKAEYSKKVIKAPEHGLRRASVVDIKGASKK